MQTALRKIGLLFLAAAFLAACSEDSAVAPVPAGISSVHTIRAGFAPEDPDTRSRLEFSESAAQVLWTAGDQFKMVKMSASGHSTAIYTTQDDGVATAVFTSDKTLSGDDFTSAYPASFYRGVGRRGETGCSFITPVPSEQEAVPGGLKEGLNLAAAWSDSPDADLCFHNLLSIVRFRVDGACVSSLASVTFDAGTLVAGEATAYFEDGVPHLDFSVKWSNPTVERSTSVTLSGDFTEGQDYCIALVPADLPYGFNMIFRDAEGHVLPKHTAKALTLRRGRIVDFGTIHLGDTWEPEEKEEVIEYIHQTKGSKKNVIAILADGFREEELSQFEILAKGAFDYLFGVEPFKSYKEYFTAYYCRVPSNESGAGVIDKDGNILTPVDNYFGSRWPEETYGNMTADAATVQEYLKTHIPEVVSKELSYKDVPTMLMINDNRYGGICHVYGSGWSYSQVPYQYDGREIRWSFPKYQAVNPRDDSEGYRETTDAERDEMGRNIGDWRNTMLHEFGGHGYGRLTDEYWNTSFNQPGAISGHAYSVPYALNVAGVYEEIPWQEDLLDRLDDLTARNPDYARIGIWHGGQNSLYYRWRSEKTSCMIDNRPYFSTWQRIRIVRRILEKAGETFDMDDFLAKDVTTDPVRPVGNESPETLKKARSRALLVPEMPMLPPPVLHEEE